MTYTMEIPKNQEAGEVAAPASGALRGGLGRLGRLGVGLAFLWLQATWTGQGRAQGDQPEAAESSPKSVAAGAVAAEDRAWSFSASLYTYVIPESQDYAQPTFTADRDWLHLEARYNYEDLETGSAWIGYNFGGGERLAWEFTPMLGGVFGNTTGIAPGYRGSLSWWKLELYSEGEYVIDTGDSSGSFFYNWSELTLAPAEWFRFGMVTQRTRAYDSDREVQRGLLVGFTYKISDFAIYAFNPDKSRPIYVFAVSLNF
jgi:hypothetical protein